MSDENGSKTEPAQVLYWCPTAREIEQQPGGGFDVCCHAPEMHEPVLAAVYAAIRQQVAEEIATRADGIAENYQATAVAHRDLSHEHGRTLKGTSHMTTAHAFRNKADGAWAVAHAARQIGGAA